MLAGHTSGQYQGRRVPVIRPMVLVTALGLLALGAGLLSLGVGAVPIPLSQTISALFGGGDLITRTIVVDLRLPRAIAGFLVGGMLGIAGAALQGFLRNPLVEPSVLGISNTAALGAVGTIYFGLGASHLALVPLSAITGALISLVLLFMLAGRAESSLTLILAGIAIATFSGAAISLALNLSPNPFAGMEIMTWLLGSLENRSIEHVAIAAVCIIPGIALLLIDRHALDALALGEECARTLGVNLRITRLRLLAGVAIGVGGAVAISGAIGFVGLIVPHLVRPLTDKSPSAVLLPSLFGGAALLTLADILVRIIPTTPELRLGVVTAFLGVPIFMLYLLREKRLW